MAVAAAGIIFSNLHDRNIPELTRVRTIASVPFACRYRFIDFPLSNMINAGITNINIIAQYNYHSLMDHIGSGKDWDLALRSGGIKILPPYIAAYANTAITRYNSRLDALKSVYYSLMHIPEEYVVLSDTDAICNIDINAIIEDHVRHNADITMVAKKTYIPSESIQKTDIVESDECGCLTALYARTHDTVGYCDVAVNIWVMKTEYLKRIVSESIAHDYTSLTRDIVNRNLGYGNFRVYRYDGYLALINSFAEYFAYSMDIIESSEHRSALFNVPNRPILTKIRNSAPTKYISGAMPKNSLVADGCAIYGEVENSILFRGVKIGKNAVVKNSILFQDTTVGDSSSLNCVISDKNTTIRDGRRLSGHSTHPFYIEKSAII